MGAVLYEMVTGEPPQTGATVQAVIAKLLSQQPTQPRIVRHSIPQAMDRAIMKALAKVPADRFGSASEFAAALTVRVAKPEAEVKSIVVLPFENLSPDPENEYFSDGLTDELIADLSKLHSLRVISRNSAMQLKGTAKDTKTIGRELNVQYVLEGTVRKAGNRLRITAQLIDAARDTHFWTEKYDGVLEDVFDMQEKVSRSIVDALRLSLTPEEDRHLTERPIENAEAYQCYLRARREMMGGAHENLERALHNLRMGLEVLGENEILYQGMAEVHLQRYEYGVKSDEETLQQAEELASRMESLRPDSAYGHYFKGRIERYRGSSTRAADHWERALAIDPNHINSLIWLVGAYAIQAGRPELADPLVKRLTQIDPLTPLTIFVIGMFHWTAGRLDEALSAFQRCDALDPGTFWLHPNVAYLLVWRNERDKALALLDQIIERSVLDIYAQWASFVRHALRGEKSEALAALSEGAKSYLWVDPEAQWLTTSTYALLGEKDEALKWLEHMIDRGWINYPLLSQQDPLLESLRGEERFRELMVDVKREWEAFGAAREVSPVT